MTEIPNATTTTKGGQKSYEAAHHKQQATYRKTWERRNPAPLRNWMEQRDGTGPESSSYRTITTHIITPHYMHARI
jgi:hypothetical protein